MAVNWKEAQQKAALTAKWAVTMTKVRIRQVVSPTRWQLVTFYGKSGAESVGVVDLLAIREDPGETGTWQSARRRVANHPHSGQGWYCREANVRRRGEVAQSQRDTLHVMSFSRLGRRERLRVSFACASAREAWTEITNLDSIFR
jgi:hypothetical protein